MNKIEKLLLINNTHKIALILLVTLFGSMLFVSFGLLIRYAVDSGESLIDTEKLLGFITIFLIIRLFMPLFYSISEVLTHNMIMNTLTSLRSTALTKIININMAQWETKNRGEINKIIDKMLSSSSAYMRFMCSDMLPIVMQTMMVIITVGLSVNIFVALEFAILVVLYGFFIIYMTKKRIPLIKQVAISEKQLSGRVFNLMQMMKMDRAYDTHYNSCEQVNTAVSININHQKKIRNEFFLFGVNSALFSVLSSAAILYSTFILIINNSITYGGLVMIATFLFQIFLPINRFGMLYRQIKMAKSDFVIYLDEIDNMSEFPPNSINLPLSKNENMLFIKNNNHAITLYLKKGEVTFLKGQNGTGKSTLAKLLAGIILDKNSIFQINKVAHHNNGRPHGNVLYIPQDISLLSSTIENNILHFSDKKSIDIVIDNLEKLNFKKKLIHEVTSFGDNLSGGEKQKLGISFSLGKEKDLYIFDEPTKGFDEQSTTAFSEIIANLALTKFIIIITHDKNLLTQLHSYNIVEIN